MHGLLQDLRYALRALRRAPSFAAVAVVSLALGIGANAAAFSLVSSMVLRPLPVEEPGRLVALYTRQGDAPPGTLSYPDYVDYRRLTGVFEDLAAHNGAQLSLAGADRSEMVWGEMVTASYFGVVGARPVLGRAFLPEEDVEGGRPVAILGHGLWQRRFGGERDVVGRAIRLNGREFTVVGVAPPGFVGTRLFAFAPEIFVPLALHPVIRPETAGRLEERGTQWLNVAGRLRPGVTLERAQAAVSAMSRSLERDHADTHRGLEVEVYANRSPINPWVLDPGRIRQMTALLMLAMSLVLAIACANVANLLLARAADRQREIALRLSLGASRARLVRQLLTESLVLAVLGGGFGLLLALWLVDLSGALVPTLDFATAFEVSLDGRVVAFTAAVSLVTGLVFGLAPALRASRPSLVPALKEDTAGAFGGRSRAREALVVAEIALALLLLVGAGLFVRSFRNAQALDPGFNPDGVLLASVHLGLQGYDETRQEEFRRRVVERVAALPGVTSTSLAFPLPLDAYSWSEYVTIQERPLPPGERRPEVFASLVGPGYFQTLETPLLAGRAFDERDRTDGPPVAIVNQAFARRFWPGGDPLGRRIRVGPEEGPWLEVVGVARDGKYLTLGELPRPYLFLPLEQRPYSRITILARTEGDPELLLPSLRAAVRELDPALPLYAVRTGRQQMETPLSGAQSGAATVGLFGALALVLASAGIYGVVSYAVARRVREIGIRMSLGARGADVVRMVVARGAALAGLGIALGLAGAVAIGRAFAGMLYGVSGTDPLTYAAVAAMMGSVALVASLVPARRASRVHPTVALRAE